MFTRIYIHIPFCRRKCPYCAFVSRQGGQLEINAYVGLLRDEMRIVRRETSSQGAVDSVYIGGGTPSLLSPSQVTAILEQSDHLFGLGTGAEITLEANPATVDAASLSGFRAAGINRLSLGIQSFDASMLAALGRIHTPGQAHEAFTAARAAGFDNISIDLIHALPGQTADMWRADLKQALHLAPEHISVYGLSVENGTPFAERYPEGSQLLPDQDLAADMFEEADGFLTAGGYGHYEIANYARPGFHSRHNSGYWRRDGYLGLGAGAHSFLRAGTFGLRFSNAPELKDFGDALRRGELPRRDITELTRLDAMAEFMYLGLRLAEGVHLASFEQEFGLSVADAYGEVIDELVRTGLLETGSRSLFLTRRGQLLSNRVFTRFLP